MPPLPTLNGAPAILEGFVDFSHEVSVIAARGARRRRRLLRSRRERAPGRHPAHHHRPRPPDRRRSAPTPSCWRRSILNALDYVGVLGVELFVTPQGLIVNEIAPRVHNSGHWTQNGCAVDQFEQHIRAIAGWPLGDGPRHADVVDGKPDRR